MNEVAVNVSNVTRTFPETGSVLSNLSLKIEKGEFLALLGPSGCGKSTLLRMIAGLDHADQGEITIHSTRARGFVFQDASLLPWRSALENVALPLELMKVEKSEAEDKARQALSRVGLLEATNRLPSELSGGMRMRVSLARALVAEPELLFLDEPFAALDEGSRFRLQEDLRSLWEMLGMTVLFVTHSISEAALLANRTVVFSARPARVLLDRRSSLGNERSDETRVSPSYIQEMQIIRRAFSGEPS